MMERMREGVNSIAVKIILGLIILSFVFAGVGSYITGGSGNTAAKVGNVEISRGEFEQAYQNERNRMQSQMGDYFSTLLADPNYVESFRKSVLDRMINDVLLEQHAESLGLRIGDAQIRQMILEMPQFQSDGKFDQDIYQATLRRAGFSADSFAEYLRTDIVRNQLLSALQGSEFTLPSEIELQSQLLTQTRDIKTLTLSLADFSKKASLTEEEIQQYYDANPAQFTRPEQLKISYVELSAQALKGNVDISDEQVTQYYNEHLDKYSTAEQRKVSHILIQGDDEAKAQSILDELNAGADFATLAQEKSDDFGSAEEGGSLGWIERDVMDPAFEEAAFALQNVGDRTQLVKSDFGYHIIQLDEIKASESKPLADVKDEIVSELADQLAVDDFYNLQNELEKIAFEYPDSLDDAASAINQKVVTTDFVSLADVPAILQNQAVMQALQSPEVKEDGLNSEAMEVEPEHIVVVRVEEVRNETVLPLEEVSEQVKSQLANVKGEQAAMALGVQLVNELKEGKTDALTANALSFGELEAIDRSSALAGTVFAMAKPAEGEVTFAQAKDAEGNVVVIELSKVAANADPMYNEQIGAQMERAATQQDLASVLTILRKNTEIEYLIVAE
ncbi:peptidylprolyl isomerase [Vibrio sp. 10N.286.49.C2]|uniref:peptidylprolyl isomerase n=1 Tax=unclassified Vibrio TaxID=2614977 RepID=UPI000C8519BD|nr:MULTISPECIES: peptidylprolyl isomerase [unclassified Vibrio]PMH33079.1 peptidylprolyl isomerase [Vibrio sp. 10N.286.49.C2]PMH48976.1 peptidylprolyl isomerase [Vibrio sp. 10N.286.49.B1]PMH78599.1 peptidylprolyl isomerase [Vibrio sp. 10N.286.48.B7]